MEETTNAAVEAQNEEAAEAGLMMDQLAEGQAERELSQEEKKARRAERHAAAAAAFKAARDAEMENAREIASDFTGFLKREVPTRVETAKKTGAQIMGDAQMAAAGIAASITDKIREGQEARAQRSAASEAVLVSEQNEEAANAGLMMEQLADEQAERAQKKAQEHAEAVEALVEEQNEEAATAGKSLE